MNSKLPPILGFLPIIPVTAICIPAILSVLPNLSSFGLAQMTAQIAIAFAVVIVAIAGVAHIPVFIALTRLRKVPFKSIDVTYVAAIVLGILFYLALGFFLVETFNSDNLYLIYSILLYVTSIAITIALMIYIKQKAKQISTIKGSPVK
jgi:hypothetical protein